MLACAIMTNQFIHVELATRNSERAKKFYTQLFDWQMEYMPAMKYTMITAGKGVAGGMWQDKKNASQWMPYVLVDDIAISTQKAKKLGAKVLKDVIEVPGAGWMSVLADPTGAVIGLWKPAPKGKKPKK